MDEGSERRRALEAHHPNARHVHDLSLLQTALRQCDIHATRAKKATLSIITWRSPEAEIGYTLRIETKKSDKIKRHVCSNSLASYENCISTGDMSVHFSHY